MFSAPARNQGGPISSAEVIPLGCGDTGGGGVVGSGEVTGAVGIGSGGGGGAGTFCGIDGGSTTGLGVLSANIGSDACTIEGTAGSAVTGSAETDGGGVDSVACGPGIDGVGVGVVDGVAPLCRGGVSFAGAELVGFKDVGSDGSAIK